MNQKKNPFLFNEDNNSSQETLFPRNKNFKPPLKKKKQLKKSSLNLSLSEIDEVMED